MIIVKIGREYLSLAILPMKGILIILSSLRFWISSSIELVTVLILLFSSELSIRLIPAILATKSTQPLSVQFII